MRILFAFAGGQGHLDPLMPLARAAVAAGHAAAVTGRAELLPAIRQDGFEALESPGDQPDPAARMPLKPYDPAGEERALREWYAGTLARRRAEALARLAREWRADVIVRDEVDYGARIAAERLGIPSACVLVIAAAPFLRTAIADERVAWLRGQLGLTGDPPPETVLSPFPRSLRDEPGALAFRGGDPPLAGGDAVYLTLGTVFNAESGDLLARALAGVRSLGVPVVVTTGRQIDPAELGPQPPHVRIQPFIPQEELLPRCRAVVSHGGSGSALGALAHGLPAVLLPIGADQPHTAALVAGAGAGIVLDPVAATSEDVAAALRRVIDEPAYGEAARGVRAEWLALPAAAEALKLVAPS